MKKIIFILALIFSLQTIARDFSKILASKTLKIAVDTTYPPMEFENLDGHPIGLDVDLAKALANELGLKAEFVVMKWDGILAGLHSDRYDIIMSSMNITPEREKEADFISYLNMGQVFVTKTNHPKLNSEKDLSGKKIAVQADTTSFTAAEAMKAKGIKILEIKAFNDATSTFSALKSNQADVIVIDEAVGLYYAGLDSKTFKVNGEAMKPEPIGIALKKNQNELKNALSKALEKIKKEKKFHAIYKQWLKKDFK